MSFAASESRVALAPLAGIAASALFASSAALSLTPDLCEPSLEVRQEIAKASSATPESGTFEELTAAFKALRERFPNDLFAHVRYQDAVNERGIEGHLKALTEEYLALRDAHPGELLYQYLQGRTLEGRSTKQAIAAMEEVLASDASFAPAHRTLAEIYASAAFRDQQKEKAERARFGQLCPGSSIAQRPTPPPERSKLWSQAEALLKQAGSDERVPELVYRALEQDEWRQQRIRPFDWYATSYKKALSEEVQMEYWKGWALVVQHFWKTDQTEKADQLLAEMQDRLSRLERNPASPVYWAGATTMVSLYGQAKQPVKVRQTLKVMQTSLKAKPDGKRAAQLGRLKAKFLPRG
jgi:hypothetical protein